MGRKKRQEMSGLFDYFKKKSEQKSAFESGALVPASPSHPPAAPKKQKMDLFAFLAPQSNLPVPAGKEEKKSFFSRFLPPVPVAPSEMVPAERKSIFDVIAPKKKPQAEAAPEPAAPSQPMAVWEGMFTAKKEEPPVSKMFEMIPKEEAAPEEPPPPKYVFLKPSSPPILSPARPHWMTAPSTAPVMEWTLPSPQQLADHFARTMDLQDIFEMIQTVRATPEFKKDQLIYSWQGVPMMIPIDPIVYKEEYTDFANFYGIPWGVIQMYVDVPQQYEKAGADALWNNVLSPLNAMVPEAFELLKPRSIPGFFNASYLEPSQQQKGQSSQYWLNYVEPKLEGIVPPPGGFGGA